MEFFVNLPKFAQIPNWWRHTGCCVHFQTSKPIFSDSATIFTLERIVPYLLWQCIVVLLQFFKHEVIILKCPIFPVFPPVTSSIAPVNLSNFRDEKWPKNNQTLNEHNFAKNWYFLMRFFLFAWKSTAETDYPIKMGGKISWMCPFKETVYVLKK